VKTLVTGTPKEIEGFATEVIPEPISARQLFGSGSPIRAREYTEAALKLVHKALEGLLSAYRPLDIEQLRLEVFLHEAVVAALTSPRLIEMDDLRFGLALECATRSRIWAAEMMPDLAMTVASDMLVGEMKRLEPGVGKTAILMDSNLIAQCVTYIRALVSADLTQHTHGREYLSKLGRLRSGYGLSDVELAALLDVTRQALHKWETGRAIAPQSAVKIDRALALLYELETYVKPGLLPTVVRRPGRKLRGRTPLSLILAGKGDEVARYFEILTTADVAAG